MFDWKRWILPGLATVVVLTPAAVMVKRHAVETDLTSRTQEATRDLYPWAEIEASGRDLRLGGIAPSESAASEALDLARKVRGVRIAASRAELLAPQSPYRLSVIRSGGRLTLKGFVPDEATHATIASLASATVPDAELVDELKLARGAPENFVPLVGYAVAQLAGLKDGAVEFEDSRISVRGLALSSIAYENVLDALDALLPGAEVASVEIEPPSVSPYAWTLSRQGDEITLEGHVPTRAKRETVAADIRSALADAHLQNRLAVAAGLSASVDWSEATAFLAGQLALMTSGSIQVSDGTVSVSGIASSAEAFETLVATFDRDLPAGLQLVSAQISRPVVSPYIWTFEKDGDGNVFLSGFAPDRETAVRLVSAAHPDADAPQPDDELQIAAGAPEDFESAALAVLGASSRLARFKATITDKAVSLEGEALTGIAANETRNRIASALPAGFTLGSDIAVRPPGAELPPVDCRDALAGDLERASIRFETGSAGIRNESLGLLDRLAFTLRRCPQARFEVGGHTDSDGTEEANLALSVERASAVVDALVRAGVRYSRLQAKGYGESLPVADNASEEGRARNRRIEFRIVNQN